MTIRSRITAAADQIRQKGNRPRRVYLTSNDASQLQYELLAEGGRTAHAIMRDGIRRAVPRLLGLQIVWRSPQFQVV